MGLHWDYRMVLGDKAYSWATKKEMPEPGKAIILFEQPVHDREYALSEKVVIPKGEYGGGTTYLDWVRKAKVEPEDEPGKIVINVGDGTRFLLKKMGDNKYGDKSWLFKNLTPPKKLEKKAVFSISQALDNTSQDLFHDHSSKKNVIDDKRRRQMYSQIASNSKSKGYSFSSGKVKIKKVGGKYSINIDSNARDNIGRMAPLNVHMDHHDLPKIKEHVQHAINVANNYHSQFKDVVSDFSAPNLNENLDKAVIGVHKLHRNSILKKVGLGAAGIGILGTGVYDYLKNKEKKITKQAAVSDIESKFTPDLTPGQMRILGVLRHKGSQYGEGTDKDNFFGVRASLDTWPETWHNEEHPQGWYQWYQGYHAGKRTSDDERQMKRWISFKARHLSQLQKADPTLSDMSVQPKRRQALMNWGIAPGINVEEEMEKKMRGDKYLEKTAVDPISLAAMHAVGTHVLQNVGLKHALKSKALAHHISSGFKEGIRGVVDTSVKRKSIELASGALLPEVNALHRSAWSAGKLLGPHLKHLDIKQKAGLHMLVSGKVDSALKRGFHKDPKVMSAYETLRGSSSLPGIKTLQDSANKIISSVKSNSLTNNVVRNINKSKLDERFLKPGVPSNKVGVAGGLLSSVLDPTLGGLNTVKNLASSNRIRHSALGSKFVNKVEEILLKNPFRKGVSGKVDISNKSKRLLNDLTLGPINTQLKDFGNAVKK